MACTALRLMDAESGCSLMVGMQCPSGQHGQEMCEPLAERVRQGQHPTSHMTALKHSLLLRVRIMV